MNWSSVKERAIIVLLAIGGIFGALGAVSVIVSYVLFWGQPIKQYPQKILFGSDRAPLSGD
jgi:hypothetical protein